MVIAIDWDGTITQDAELFAVFIGLCVQGGHTPIIVTQRSLEQGTEITQFVQLLKRKFNIDVPTVWASGFTKGEAATNAGFDVDVWIDDNPIAVYTPLVYMGNTDESQN